MSSNLGESGAPFRAWGPEGQAAESVQDRVRRLTECDTIKSIFDRNDRYGSELNSNLFELARDGTHSDRIIEQAFEKSSIAIVSGIRVFISYKTSQEQNAKSFLKLLMSLIRSRADDHSPFPFLAGYGSSIDAGANWRDRIQKAIEDTHWFFLLKPEDTVDPEWLVFEAGYFRRGMMPGDKLICVYGPRTSAPAQISNLQGVEATKDKLTDMLKGLVRGQSAVPGMFPINKDVGDKEIENVAAKMAKLFLGDKEEKLKRRYFANCVDLCLKNISRVSNLDELKSLNVIQVKGEEPLFGRVYPPATFGDLVANLESDERNKIWLEQLAGSVGDALRGSSPTQPTVTFRGYKDGRVYRPFLYAARIYEGADRPESVHIAFAEDVTAPMRFAPPALASLETALRLAYRFQWEILAAYDGTLTKDDVRNIERIMLSMEAEASQRGLFDPESLASLFPEKLSKKLRYNYVEYRKYRGLSPESGLMDRAFKELNNELTLSCIKAIGKINSWFLREGTPIYAALTAKYLPE